MPVSLSLRCDGDRLLLLDQTRLPQEEAWVDATAPEAMIAAIRALRVRGAPLIGAAAALCLGIFARGRTDLRSPDFRSVQAQADLRPVREVAAALRAARPTAVNLMYAIDRMMGRLYQAVTFVESGIIQDIGEILYAEACAIFDEDAALCERIAAHGAPLIGDGEGVLTHCNTGALATAGIGTALGVIRRAHEAGRRLHVYVDETRPLLQGGRLTAWELQRLGVPCTLITDSMAALLMRDGRVQRVLVGADRIARSGDAANKVGTYGAAVAARFHGVPFHIVAPWSTVDPGCPDGASIPIEERHPDEVRGAAGAFGSVRWAPEAVPVWNPAFDVTPAALITSLITDRGVFQPADPGFAADFSRNFASPAAA